MQGPLKILYEDNHLLAVDKPAGLPTMGVNESEASLWTEAKAYLKAKYNKPGNVYLGVVSRLDAVTTGVVLLARTSKAAKRLSEMFRSRSVEKAYWGVVEGRLSETSGSYTDWLLKDEASKQMIAVPPGRPAAKEAKLTYRRLAHVGDCSVVEINLETGRKHQIRVQFASRGHAILGDRKYGSRRRFPDGIALHARQIGFIHPVQKTHLVVTSCPPESWRPYIPGNELH